MYSSDFVDIAYKTGCGRYIQREEAIKLLPEELELLECSRVFLITGENSRKAAGDLCVTTLKDASVFVSEQTVAEHPTEELFSSLAAQLELNSCDVVVGVGGGRIMDIAKAVATLANVPVVQVPTSVATCAAFSTCIVVYSSDGGFAGAWRLIKEVDAIVVDLNILKEAPARLLAAGILDSMAKRLEIAHNKGELTLQNDSFTRFCAYKLAETAYEILTTEGLAAYKANGAHKFNDELDNIVFTNLCLTGVVTSLTRNLRQIGLGHKFYDGLKCVYGSEVSEFLHGELVAIGLRFQAVFNNQPELEQQMVAMMKEMKMPLSLKDLGIRPQGEKFMELKQYVRNSGFICDEDEEKFEKSFKVTYE